MARKWWTLVLVCTAILMLLLDITVVNVALPDIERELGADFTELQWVVDAYALTLATVVLTAGALADRFGRKRAFVTGVALFTGASLLCALATTPLFLILARALQGIGGATMFATSLALLSQEFHGRERGTAFGIWGATTGTAVAIGPLVGGLLTGISWRWIFLVNIPIGVLALAASVLRLGESSDPERSRFDLAGFATFSGGLFLLVFSLLRGNDEGWSSALIVATLAGAAVLLAGFLAAELRQRRPMLDLSLFRKLTFVGAQTTAFGLSFAVFALFLYLTLYLQNVLGYSPLQAGLRFLPITALSFLVAPLSGKVSAYLPPRLLLGAGLGCAGLALLLMHGLSSGSRWTALLPGFLLLGIGVGLTNPPLASVAIGVASPTRSGMASGINNTSRQVGIATGIATLGAVFQHHVQTAVAGALSSTPVASRGEEIGHAVATGGGRAFGGAPPEVRARLAQVARTAFVGGLNEIFLVSAAVAFAAALLALAFVRRRDLVQGELSASEAERGRRGTRA
jgi:EmrB/QacA subfamily drug resistance transporter